MTSTDRPPAAVPTPLEIGIQAAEVAHSLPSMRGARSRILAGGLCEVYEDHILRVARRHKAPWTLTVDLWEVSWIRVYEAMLPNQARPDMYSPGSWTEHLHHLFGEALKHAEEREAMQGRRRQDSCDRMQWFFEEMIIADSDNGAACPHPNMVRSLESLTHHYGALSTLFQGESHPSPYYVERAAAKLAAIAYSIAATSRRRSTEELGVQVRFEEVES